VATATLDLFAAGNPSPSPPSDAVCDADGAINPDKLLTWALYTQGQLPPGLISRSFDLRNIKDSLTAGKAIPPPIVQGDKLPTEEQMQAMALEDLCLTADNKGPCGKFAAQQRDLVGYLAQWAATPSKTLTSEQQDATTTWPLADGRMARRIEKPTAIQRKTIPILDPRYYGTWPLNEFLVQNPPLWRVACATDSKPVPATPSTASAPASAPALPDLTHFRIRKTTDDLVVAQSDDDAFKGVSGATFGFKQDIAADKITEDVTAVLGYALPRTYLGQTSLDHIPFVKYDHHVTSPTKPGTPDVNNIGFGWLEDIVSGLSPTIQNELTITPVYVRSIAAGTEIVQVNVYDRLVPFDFLAHSVRAGPVDVQAKIAVRVSVGHVVSSGTLADFAATNNFVRFGGSVDGTIAGASGTLLEQLVLKGTYVYFRQNSDTPKSIPRREIALSYAFQKQKFVTLDASYISGRNLDSLQLEKYWSVGLGVKY